MTLKTITRVIVNRLRPILDSVIDETQGSFLPGRGTHGNILLVQEIIHSFCKKKVRQGYLYLNLTWKGTMAIKIDLSKAYDRLRWDFIKDTLEQLHIPSNWVSLIMHVISSASMSIIWDDDIMEPFTPSHVDKGIL